MLQNILFAAMGISTFLFGLFYLPTRPTDQKDVRNVYFGKAIGLTIGLDLLIWGVGGLLYNPEEFVLAAAIIVVSAVILGIVAYRVKRLH